jgi:hypothetical protein
MTETDTRPVYVCRCVTQDHAPASSPPFATPEQASTWMRKRFPSCKYVTTERPTS